MKIAWKLTIIYCLIFSLLIVGFSVFFYFNTKRVLLAQHRKKLVESVKQYKISYVVKSQHYIARDSEVVNDPFKIGEMHRNGLVYRSKSYYLFVRQGKIVAGGDITTSMLALDNLKKDLFSFSIAGILLSVLIGYFLSLGTLAPIRKITSSAKDITAKNLHEKIEVPNSRDELWELSTTINDMLDRIDRSYTMQEQFIADVSHELKTPITSIIGYVRLLERWGKKDEQVLDESIVTIKETAENMENLISSLLNLARTHEKIVLEKINIEDFILKRTDNYKKMYPDFKFEVEISDRKQSIETSPSLLEILINILVENAVRHSDKEKVIDLGYQEGRFFVRDYGKGIAEKEKEKIFQRFYKTDKSRGSEGHGLGLSLAKKIADSLGMTIEIMGEEGEGTTFSVSSDQLSLNSTGE